MKMSLGDSDFLCVDVRYKSVGSMSFDLFDSQSHDISLTLKFIQPPGNHHNYHLGSQPTAGNLVLRGCPGSEENAKEVKRIMELDNAHISVGRSTTAINITKSEEYMLNQFRKIPYIDVGIVDYSGAVPQVLISNENRIVDAYLNLGLVEVTDEN